MQVLWISARSDAPGGTFGSGSVYRSERVHLCDGLLPNKRREPPGTTTFRTSERKSKESVDFGRRDAAHARTRRSIVASHPSPGPSSLANQNKRTISSRGADPLAAHTRGEHARNGCHDPRRARPRTLTNLLTIYNQLFRYTIKLSLISTQVRIVKYYYYVQRTRITIMPISDRESHAYRK